MVAVSSLAMNCNGMNEMNDISSRSIQHNLSHAINRMTATSLMPSNHASDNQATHHLHHPHQQQESLYSTNGVHGSSNHGQYAQLSYQHQQQPQQVYQTNGSIIINPMSQSTVQPSNGVPTAVILGSSPANGTTSGVIPVSGTCQDFVTVPDSLFGQKSRRDYLIIFLIFLGVVVMVVTAVASLVYLVKCE